MFNAGKKNERIDSGTIDTIIGEKAVIEGILKAEDTTRIDGIIKGEIKSEGSIIIGEFGSVLGNVSAINIVVAGTVHGNLYIRERMEVTNTGSVNGDILTKTLIIDEGASFKGSCTMNVKESVMAAASNEVKREAEPFLEEETPVILELNT